MEERLKKELAKKVRKAKEFLLTNYDLTVNEKDIWETLVHFIDLKTEALVENLDHIISNPHLEEHHEILKLLPRGSVFTGNREFSFEKLKAVIIFFASVLGAGRLSKTRANKLAFYSDFYHYKTRGRSISGSSYTHLPYGPVISGYEDLLGEMESAGALSIKESTVSDKGAFINSTDGSWRDILSEEEKDTCRLVLKHFGTLNAAEISEKSHSESAWKNTRDGELISYGFSNLFEALAWEEN